MRKLLTVEQNRFSRVPAGLLARALVAWMVVCTFFPTLSPAFSAALFAGEQPPVPPEVQPERPLPPPPAKPVEPPVPSVSIRQGSRVTVFHYRVPKNYNPAALHTYRVLVYFGGRNTTGEREARNSLNFGTWADENDIFILAPGYQDEKYWQPQEWSGAALIAALRRIRREYNINTTRLLYYGYSAGSQCANLFAAWAPKNAVAYVSHGCGVFYKPARELRGLPGLVTCGEADVQRYIISRRFVAGARAAGQNLIFKSFPNLPHSVNPDSYKLAQTFLLYHHQRNLNDLRIDSPPPPLETVAFVGDDMDGVFYEPDAFEVTAIDPEDRVYFPTRELAEAWGRYAPSRWEVRAETAKK